MSNLPAKAFANHFTAYCSSLVAETILSSVQAPLPGSGDLVMDWDTSAGPARPKTGPIGPAGGGLAPPVSCTSCCWHQHQHFSSPGSALFLNFRV